MDADFFLERVYMINTLQPVKGYIQLYEMFNIHCSYKTYTRITRRMVRIGKTNVPHSLQKMWSEKYLNKTF